MEADGGFSSAFWPAGSSSQAPALLVRERPPFACWFICLFVFSWYRFPIFAFCCIMFSLIKAIFPYLPQCQGILVALSKDQGQFLEPTSAFYLKLLGSKYVLLALLGSHVHVCLHTHLSLWISVRILSCIEQKPIL